MQNKEEDRKPNLTDADRERIEAEERLRYETRVKLERKGREWIWWVIGTPLFLLVFAWAFGNLMLRTTFTVGSECALSNPPIVFRTPEALEQFKALRGGEAGVAGTMMERRGEVFKVQPGTRVRVIEVDLNRRRVTLLEGAHQGETGWVEMGWLRQ